MLLSLKSLSHTKKIFCTSVCLFLACIQIVPAMVVMNYGADGNDYYQFTNPSMAFDKASGFTTLIMFGIHVNSDGTLTAGGGTIVTNGVYVGASNWGSLVSTLKTAPTTVNRYEVLIGGWEDTSYNNIKSLVISQGTGPGSILYKNFLALKNAVPGIDAINDDDELTYDLSSSTNFANMLGSLGYNFTLVPYTYQSFWVQLKNSITNCDYVYLQCYEGGAGNDPGNWNAAFGGSSGYSLSGFHVIPGQESNTSNPTNWTNWYLETGGQGGFYYPDIVFNTTNWSAAILNSVSQTPLFALTNNDGVGSSFNTAGNWGNGSAPSSTNGYVDSGYILDAPSSGSYTFLGNSLLINNSGTLSFNNVNGDTLTFGSNAMTGLTLDYGATAGNLNPGSSDTIAGYLNLGPDGGGNLAPGSGILNISAVIGGTGSLTVPSGSGVVVLSAINNFSGNVVVNNGALLQLQNPQSLAAGSLTLNTGSTLQLRSDNSVTFFGGDNLQGLGNAIVTLNVDQLTGIGTAQSISFASGGFNVGNSTLDFTGGHGYSLTLGSLTGVYAGPLTLNAVSANAYIASVLGGANITQLIKKGSGAVFLSGGSSYTGATIVNAGILEFQAGASGASTSLQVAGGAACRIDSSIPVLAGGAGVSINANGQLYLGAGVNLAVSSLSFGGVSQTAGSWGSSSSAATNKNDAYFSGPGILWVGVPPPAPASPTGLNATPGSNRAVLNWATSSGATGYNVKRSTTSGNEVTIANLTVNNFTDSNLTNGTTFYYEVSATNAGGESPNSTQVSVLPDFVINLTNSDALGVASFSAAGNWSSGQSPSSGSDYVDNGYIIRTPSSGNATFSGNCLEISYGIFGFKTSSGSTITVGSSTTTGLFLNDGFVSLFDSGRTENLAGYIVLNAGGGSFSPNSGTLPITSQISGSGALAVVGNASPPAVQNGIVTLSGVNSYTGGTILDTADTVRIVGFGTLGANTGSFMFTDSGNLMSTETLDLNGTSQTIGNLVGVSTARIINSAPSTASRLTIGNGGNGGGNFAGSLSSGGGVLSLIKTGAGTITLSGTNTYTGSTLISGGTLALSGSGLMRGTAAITITPGATFDVSGLSTTLSLGAGQTLAATGATGALNGNLNLGNGALGLNYVSGTPTLSVSGGTLTMNNNAVVVTNTGAALPIGSYKIVSEGSGGSVSGSVSGSTVSVAGGGVAAGTQAGLSIIGGELYLTVATGSAPVINSSFNGTALTLSWPGGGYLLQATNLLGPWTTNMGATSPFTVTPATNGPQMFYRVQQ